MKLDHVGMSVSNLEDSCRFYQEVFGFTQVEDSFELLADEIRGMILVNPDGASVELFERKGSLPSPPGHPTDSVRQQGLFQFAFSTSDLRAVFARVTAAGARSVMEPRIAPDGRTLIAFVADLDGNLVELLQR